MAQRTERLARGVPWPWLLGIGTFASAWALLHLDVFASFQIIDTPVYERYGRLMRDGSVPYRDFGLEYPPGALPMFIAPTLAGDGRYRPAFEAVHGALGALLVVVVALIVARVGGSRTQIATSAFFVALVPLMLGTVVLTRYDYWPALLLALALLAVVDERPRLGLGLLAAAASAKLYALVVLPLLLIHISRRFGTRAAVVSALVFVVVLVAIVGPFLIIAPDGLVDALRRQTDRPLQIESFGASMLQVIDVLGAYTSSVESSFGSQNLLGSFPDFLATLTTALQLLAAVGAWVLFARLGPARGADPVVLLGAVAATLTAFVALGKVVSPQFMIWLAAVIPLVLGRWRALSLILIASALILTQAWFPKRYWDLVALDGNEAALALARNVALVALAGVLAAAWLRREPGSAST
jgi:hypothetical protein